jgi:hypothetical protein
MTFLLKQLSGGGAGSVLTQVPVTGFSGEASNTFTTFAAIGSFALDPSDFPGTYTFESVLEVTDTYTAEVRLYDVTAAAAVAGSTLSSTSDTPEIVSASVTPASGARVYEVQLRVTATGGTAVCKFATLRVGQFASLTISPAQITANQNNYAPTDWSTATHARLNTDTSRDITGFDADVTMELKVIINVGSSDLVLKHESASSDAANRILAPSAADLTLGAGDAVSLYYDSTSSRWRCV